MQWLKNELVNGYKDGNCVLYVPICNNKNESLAVSNDISDSWSGLWKSANDGSKAHLASDLDFTKFADKMFYVRKGNHRLTTWWLHINNFHDDNKRWHMLIHCIILDPQNQTDVLLDAMNDINWYAL